MKNKIIAFLKKSNKSKKGITLVEVLVALAITSIVVAGVTSGLSFSYNTILKDGMVDTASSAAQDMMDTIVHSVQRQNGNNIDEAYIKYTLIPELNVSGVGTDKAYTDDVVYIDWLTASSGFPQQYDDTKKNSRQFTIKATTVDGIKGYEVKVAVCYYFNGDMSFATLENFIASTAAK